MLTLLSMLGGGALRLIPFIVDFFKAKQDADHEFRMAQLQLEIDKARASQAIDLANAQAAIAVNQGEMGAWADAIKAEAQRTGIAFIDWLSASVRPILTYYWCIGLYGGAKAVAIAVAIQESLPLKDYAPMLVTEFDQAVIGSILSFWFVDRAIRKMSGK